jgi:hypothetical protein
MYIWSEPGGLGVFEGGEERWYWGLLLGRVGILR